jgi:hypothetical protein
MIFNWELFCFLEYSISFVQALKHAKDDDEVKEVLGGHMMELHQRCIAIKLAFARHAHATGKYHCITAVKKNQFSAYSFGNFAHLAFTSNSRSSAESEMIAQSFFFLFTVLPRTQSPCVLDPQ